MELGMFKNRLFQQGQHQGSLLLGKINSLMKQSEMIALGSGC